MIGNEHKIYPGVRTISIALLIFFCAFSHALFADESKRNGKTDATIEEPIIVIIGASYAKSWEVKSLGKYRVINKGVGGEQTQQMLARFNDDVIKLRPRAVLIWGFMNDVSRSARADMPATLTRVRQNTLAMLAKANAAGIRPILATETPITSPDHLSEKLLAWIGKLRGKQSYQEYVNTHVREVNQWIRRIGKEKNVRVLNFESIVTNETGERQRRYAVEDGSHLSREAYAALTEYANSELAK